MNNCPAFNDTATAQGCLSSVGFPLIQCRNFPCSVKTRTLPFALSLTIKLLNLSTASPTGHRSLLDPSEPISYRNSPSLLNTFTHWAEPFLIVGARLQLGNMHGLSRLFSLKPWKLRHPWRQSGIPGSLLFCTWSLQSTAHLKPFPRNFFVYGKHVHYSPGWSNSNFQDLVMDFQRLFYTNHEFQNRTFFSLRLIFFFSVSSISFNCRTQSNSIHELSSIEFDWNLVRLGSIYYAGLITHEALSLLV